MGDDLAAKTSGLALLVEKIKCAVVFDNPV